MDTRKRPTLRAQMLIFSNIALVAGALTVGLATGPAGAVTASSPAAASSTIKIDSTGVCLTNAPTQCADVKNDNNTAGTRIWLYPKSQGKSNQWILVSNPNCGAGAACNYFQDAANTNLCMTAMGTGGANVELQNCDDAGSWYNEGGNLLGNGAFGERGNLEANSSATGYYLYANEAGNWHQWNS